MANGIRNAASIMNQMKYSPIKQKEMEGAVRQEGYDNKAVSQYDRMVGKQVAGEESRMQDLDNFADQLAMRKDKLSFARKVQKQTEGMQKDRLSMQEDAFSHRKTMTGIESVIGLAAVGTEYYRGKKQKEMDVFTMEQLKAQTAWFKQHTGVQTQPKGMDINSIAYWDDYEY